MHNKKIERDGFTIKITYSPDHLETVVFGGDYVPPSVRSLVEKSAPLRIDEDSATVLFACTQSEEQIADFIDQARSWSEKLNERGQRDLLAVSL